MRSLRLAIALLLALQVPATAQVWIWSQTPTTNANIDPTINWQEGMPPSAVDDSARATLAGVAKWRDDSSGLVTLTGTSTAYAATTNQGNQGGLVSSLVPGYRLCFSPNVSNGASPTIAVDGQAAKPIRRAQNVNLVGGELQVLAPYCATYDSNNGGEFVLNDFYALLIGPGTITTTMLANGAVTYAKIQNETNATILGNDTGGAAPPSELTLGTGLSFLTSTSVGIANGAITSSLIATSAVGTTQIANSSVTYSKIQNETNATLLGNNSGSAAAPSEITLGTALSFSSSTQFGVTAGGIGTTQLANSGVTYAKIQNESTVTLLGNPTGGAAAPSEITLGTGLSFSGSVISSKIVDNSTVYSGGTSGNCLYNNSGVVVTGGNACAFLNVADQTLTGGANVNPATNGNLGTFSSGTLTVDCGKVPLQYFTDNGAFTLAAPSNDGSCILYDLNGASAGAITFSGFTVGANVGDALDTTNAHKFFINIARINGVATYVVKALQ